MNGQIAIGILLPFLGTSLGGHGVFLKHISTRVQKALAGFAAGSWWQPPFGAFCSRAGGKRRHGIAAFLPAAIGFLVGGLSACVGYTHSAYAYEQAT